MGNEATTAVQDRPAPAKFTKDDLTALFGAELDMRIKPLTDQINPLVAQLAQIAPKPEEKVDEKPETAELEQAAEMAAPLLAPLENALNGIGGAAGIPLGSIFVGGGSGVVVSEVVDAVVPSKVVGGFNVINILGKGAAAWAIGNWGTTLMSRQATVLAMGTLGVGVLMQFVDLRAWGARIAGMIPALPGGAAPQAQLRQGASMRALSGRAGGASLGLVQSHQYNRVFGS